MVTADRALLSPLATEILPDHLGKAAPPPRLLLTFHVGTQNTHIGNSQSPEKWSLLQEPFRGLACRPSTRECWAAAEGRDVRQQAGCSTRSPSLPPSSPLSAAFEMWSLHSLDWPELTRPASAPPLLPSAQWGERRKSCWLHSSPSAAPPFPASPRLFYIWAAGKRL